MVDAVLTVAALHNDELLGELDDTITKLTVRASALEPGKWLLEAPDTAHVRAAAAVADEPGAGEGGILVSDPDLGFVWSGITTKAQATYLDRRRIWRLEGIGHAGLLDERLALPSASLPWPAGEYSTATAPLDTVIVELANAVHGPGSGARAHPRHAGWTIDRDTTQPAPATASLSGRLDTALDIIVDRLPGSGLTLHSRSDGNGGSFGRIRQARISDWEADTVNLGAQITVTRHRPTGTLIYATSKSGGSDEQVATAQAAGLVRIEAAVSASTGTNGSGSLDDAAAAGLAARTNRITIEVADAGPAALGAWGTEFALGDYVAAVADGHRWDVQFTEAQINWAGAVSTPKVSMTFGRPIHRGDLTRTRERRLAAIEGARWFL